MNPIHEEILPFWQAFQATRTDDVSARFYELCIFDDNEAAADHLAELVLSGTKRATATLVWSMEAAGLPIPEPGDLSVVADWRRQPLCVIETIRVDLVPFREVTAEFAAVEGEGDRSLEYWQDVHTASFARECARIGRVPSPEMVVCERFEMIYRP